MAESGVNTDLVRALAETKDPRLNYLWTAVSIAKEAGKVKMVLFNTKCSKARNLLHLGEVEPCIIQ